MQVHRISTNDELAQLAGPWNRLASGLPFTSYDWLGNWWHFYGPTLSTHRRKAELYVLAVTDGQELVGVAPWYLTRSAAGGAVLQFLGSGEVCSDYLSIVCSPGRRYEVTQHLAAWLQKQARSECNRWDLLEMSAVDAADPNVPLLIAALGERGLRVRSLLGEPTWRIELPATWEGYLSQLSHSHRKQLRQVQRRVLEPGKAVLRLPQSPDEFKTAWQILARLHQRRLQSLGQAGCFHSPLFTEFHRAASEALFAAGNLDLAWLEVDGRPVAAEYHLLGDRIVFAYQGGIEPSVLEKQPGRLVTVAMLTRAIAAGYTGFDFCRGNEPYKAHWRAQPRSVLHHRVIGAGSAARLRANVRIAGDSARRWVKRSLVMAGLR